MHHSSSATTMTPLSQQAYSKTTWRAWIVVMTAAWFSFYEFIQMNMLDVISQPILKTFHMNADQLGDMSSYYYLANVIFLLAAGTLLDRFSTRRVILVSLGICVFGTALFGVATTIFWVTVCRFLTGIGSAFCLLSVLRLASRWFPPRKMAMVTGMIVMFAMVGGMTSQTPFAELVSHVGWRNTLFIDALLGVFVMALIALVVRDYPEGKKAEHDEEQHILSSIGYWKSVRLAFGSRQNWLGGIYTSSINLPINVLGGLWGAMYLTTVYHFTKIDAAWVCSMLFAGTIVGSPIMGWLSDRIARRRPPMVFGALGSLFLIFFVLWMPHLNFDLLFLLFFLIGLFSSSQIIGYPLVAESSQRIVTAMSVSVVNITTVAGIGIIQRLYGYLMQAHAEQRVHHATSTYLPADFHWAMLIFLAGYIFAVLASFLVKETYCVQREK
ncbi:MAG: MFS transporter [Coxiella sp. (in: Bacteria)]|nr:MAG: MFS transporter [Coxiella sp. (in: g-proteobacteria)]